jgi:hypothetical protein
MKLMKKDITEDKKSYLLSITDISLTAPIELPFYREPIHYF